MPANTGLTATHDSAPVDLGDFVGTDEEDEVEDESEDTLQYLLGVYYPVRIGDLLHHDRYQIVHKLGRGGYSTVWLAHDRRDGNDVALKILSSTANAAKERGIHEIVKRSVQDCSRLVLLQEHFLLIRVDRNKVERKHHILVLPLYGPSILTHLRTDAKLLPDRMSAAKQILQAIFNIHMAGLVHRDIVLGNVVYGLKVDLSQMTVPDKYELLGRPRKAKALWEEDAETGKNFVIGELVAPAIFPPAIIGSDVHLCDFGILVEAGTSVPDKLQSQPGYCAPELFHDMEPSFASDMWSYMVLFLYLYTETQVFADGPGFTGVLSSIIHRVGLLPQEWKGCYGAHDKADAKDSWYGNASQGENTFGAFLDEHRPDVNADEKALVLSIVSVAFHPRPENRITASELLEHEGFQALMSIYGVQ